VHSNWQHQLQHYRDVIFTATVSNSGLSQYSFYHSSNSCHLPAVISDDDMEWQIPVWPEHHIAAAASALHPGNETPAACNGLPAEINKYQFSIQTTIKQMKQQFIVYNSLINVLRFPYKICFVIFFSFSNIFYYQHLQSDFGNHRETEMLSTVWVEILCTTSHSRRHHYWVV